MLDCRADHMMQQLRSGNNQSLLFGNHKNQFSYYELCPNHFLMPSPHITNSLNMCIQTTFCFEFSRRLV
jgi:hypothetical protein